LDTGEFLIVGQYNRAVQVVGISPDDRFVYFIEGENLASLDIDKTVGRSSPAPLATRYTNAKVLLVGDSGVGKTGLAIRLTENRFEPTVSTDGTWATHIRLPEESGLKDIEREIWLWDFAGQADYRLIHQLFMDETALAILIFNPQSEDPFDGLAQWDHALKRAARRPFKKFLVAGRCDRGGLMISQRAIDTFLRNRHFDSFFITSAKTGTGCEELRRSIADAIDWNHIPWVTSPKKFRLLKEEIIKLRDEGKVLLRFNELWQQLSLRLSESFSIGQLRTVISLLAGPGVVWQLDFGDFVLLQPDRINSYAASVIRRVRSHVDEIGCLSEEDLLSGRLDYQDMVRLPHDEEQIVLRAMYETFLRHGLCLKEATDAGPSLIFPSYFKRERPDLSQHPAPFVTYHFSGNLDEIYATLVVRLHYTSAFDHDQLWRFAADFKTPQGKRVGIKMIKHEEGTGEMTIYFDREVSEDTKVTFIRYVNDHLKSKDPNLIRTRHYVCGNCGNPINDHAAVQHRLTAGLNDIVCSRCEGRVLLWDLIEEKFASDELSARVNTMRKESAKALDQESRLELLRGHAYAVANEANQVFRSTSVAKAVDSEIEFRDEHGRLSGKRIIVFFESEDFCSIRRTAIGTLEVTITGEERLSNWLRKRSPIMLVVRKPDGAIYWMDLRSSLQSERAAKRKLEGEQFRFIRRRRLETPLRRPRGSGKSKLQQLKFTFGGEQFTALSLLRLRDSALPRSANDSPLGVDEN